MIVSEQLRGGSKEVQKELSSAGWHQRVHENLQVEEVKLRMGSETCRFVLVRSPKHVQRDRAGRARLIEVLETEIEPLNTQRRAQEQLSHRV